MSFHFVETNARRCRSTESFERGTLSSKRCRSEMAARESQAKRHLQRRYVNDDMVIGAMQLFLRRNRSRWRGLTMSARATSGAGDGDD